MDVMGANECKFHRRVSPMRKIDKLPLDTHPHTFLTTISTTDRTCPSTSASVNDGTT